MRGKRGRASKTEKGLRKRQQEKRRKQTRRKQGRKKVRTRRKREQGEKRNLCLARVVPSKTSTRRNCCS